MTEEITEFVRANIHVPKDFTREVGFNSVKHWNRVPVAALTYADMKARQIIESLKV
jgi:hypothetical protein